MLVSTLDLLALALWLGGLVVIGAVVAPTAFHVVRSSTALVGMSGAQAAIAGGVVGWSLRIFNWIALVSGVWLLISVLLLQRGTMASRTRMAVASGAAWALIITLGQMLWLFPAMDAAQAAGNMPLFDRRHHLYEALSQIQLALLVLFAVGYAWMMAARRTRS